MRHNLVGELMRLLKCKFCSGEMDIIGNEHAVNKKVKCRKCNYTNDIERKEPEVLVMRKRPINN